MWEPRSPLYKTIENKKAIQNSLRNNSKLLDVSLSEESNPISLESTSYDTAELIDVNNMFSLELFVEEGKLIMHTEIPDFDKNIQSSSRGKLQLNLKEFRLFSVTGFNNDKNLNYFCIQLNETDILHCGE